MPTTIYEIATLKDLQKLSFSEIAIDIAKIYIGCHFTIYYTIKLK